MLGTAVTQGGVIGIGEHGTFAAPYKHQIVGHLKEWAIKDMRTDSANSCGQHLAHNFHIIFP